MCGLAQQVRGSEHVLVLIGARTAMPLADAGLIAEAATSLSGHPSRFQGRKKPFAR